VISASKPLWQQVTALVSLGASGTITGFSFVPAASADLTSPTSMPIRLMALERSARAAPADNATLRSAIVNVANYYLRMAQGKTPAEMEAIIWQHDSVNGVDHGASCAAFASLTLELASHVVGQQSWVTGGTTYPWPLHKWADVRVDPNPDSPNIISVLQDAQAHGRWHPLGDGYDPQPGDWVLFDGHVEVVTKYADGVLDTIGGDSLPNFSVNAHQYSGSLLAYGIAGFVNNGYLPPAATAQAGNGHGGVHHEPGQASPAGQAVSGPPAARAASGAPTTDAAGPAIPGTPGNAPAVRAAPAGRATVPATPASAAKDATAAIPGIATTTTSPSDAGTAHRRHPMRAGRPATAAAAPATRHPTSHGERDDSGVIAGTSSGQADPLPRSSATVPGMSGAGPAGSGSAAASAPSAASASAIPGLPGSSPAAAPAQRHAAAPAAAPSASAASATSSQQTFIDDVAPGAMATQRRYGVPAAVTIAQAIDESGWGRSALSVNGHNLFGIKGTGPAGSELMSTQEYENGQWVTTQAPFRAYHNFAESIEDHGELLATSGYYTQAMASRGNPDAFANALTGVYATDPQYGQDLIQIMQQFDLYRYDVAGAHASGTPAASQSSHRPAAKTARSGGPGSGSGTATGTRPAPQPTRTPEPAHTPQPEPSSQPTQTPEPEPTSQPPTHTPEPAPTSQPTQTTQPTAISPPTHTRQPEPTPRPARTRHPARTPRPTPPVTAPGSDSSGTDATPDVPGLIPAAPEPKQAAAVTTADPVTLSFSYQHLSAAMPASASRATVADVARSAVTPAVPAATTVRASVADAMRSVATPVTAEGRPAQAVAHDATIRDAASREAAAREAPAQTAAAPSAARPAASAVRAVRVRTARAAPPRPVFYHPHLPAAVKEAFVGVAKVPIIGMELVYRDVAGHIGIPWQLLAACDWMQCQARPRFSPVHGEKLGSVNADGMVYRTKSEALEQCAYDLVELTEEIYGIDITDRPYLSVTDLANAFAAFRWGGLLKLHNTSAMEFPYSVAGLTTQLMNMRWPNIDESKTPDKPGGRFRKPFGAVPLVLSLQYPATV